MIYYQIKQLSLPSSTLITLSQAFVATKSSFSSPHQLFERITSTASLAQIFCVFAVPVSSILILQQQEYYQLLILVNSIQAYSSVMTTSPSANSISYMSTT